MEARYEFFFGPIHFWLYNKIQIREALIRSIAQIAKDKGFLRDVDQFTSEPLPEFSTAIDLKNIHGWLQDKINNPDAEHSSKLYIRV